MPKIISYTPAWLSRPSPGADIFSSQGKNSSHGRRGSGQLSNVGGPHDPSTCQNRTIASRGSEIFVVVGNEIRWSDLSMVEDDWKSKDFGSSTRSRSERAESELDIFKARKYKVLKTPVHDQTRQLILSPNNELLAVVTSHTVTIAVIPDSSHLDQPDTGPIRVKTHQLGRTVHVLSQSRLTNVLWHPLGANGECIVTVTADAAVRLWELKKESRGSFDSPTLDIDLRKLHFATSGQDDVSSETLGTNRGFSLDNLGMEVASACFGGTGSDEESGWSAMTLWVAMSEGDVFALCPLLPSRWQPSSTLIPSLTATIAARNAFRESSELSVEEDQIYQAQFEWLKDIDNQEPFMVTGKNEFTEIPIFARPSIYNAAPKLQGPFRILPGDIEDSLDLATIHVIAAKLDADELLGLDEDEELFEPPDIPGISASIVCLITVYGQVFICLDLAGVEGQWLPREKPDTRYTPNPDGQPELVLLEALHTVVQGDDVDGLSPVITPDVQSRYAFFLTHSKGVYFFSLEPWLHTLESELQSEGTAGVGFRIGILLKGSHVLRERMIRFEAIGGSLDSRSAAASIVMQDSDLGYFLLTSADERAYAVILDIPRDQSPAIKQEDYTYQSDIRLIEPAAPRMAYQPPAVLGEASAMSKFLDTNINKRYRGQLKDEIRLSSANLEIMTHAHRILSQETSKLGLAVGDLFIRCERIQEEYKDQIRRANGVAERIEKVLGEDADDYDTASERGTEHLKMRLERAKKKKEEQTKRYDHLRRKLAQYGGRALSDKEQAWFGEIGRLEKSILRTKKGSEKADDSKQEAWQRFEEVRALKEELVTEVKEVDVAEGEETSKRGSFKIPSDMRKMKMKQIGSLLERESALVDAAQERLERLSFSTAP